jgi:hypothetical protein
VAPCLGGAARERDAQRGEEQGEKQAPMPHWWRCRRQAAAGDAHVLRERDAEREWE